MRPALRRPADQDNIFAAVNDLMLGVLFLFILMLMISSLQFNSRRAVLENIATNRSKEREQLLISLQRRLEKAGSDVEIDRERGILRFKSELLFASDDSRLSPEGARALEELARGLREELPCYGKAGQSPACTGQRRRPILEAVYIEGHTDPLKPKKSRDNWELSANRARNVFEKMPEDVRAILNPGGQKMLGLSAYAETRNLSGVKREDKANRRVDFRFMLAPPTREEIAQLSGEK